jgi:hypothetical protein
LTNARWAAVNAGDSQRQSHQSDAEHHHDSRHEPRGSSAVHRRKHHWLGDGIRIEQRVAGGAGAAVSIGGSSQE